MTLNKTIVTTNKVSYLSTYMQSCATSCFDGRIDDSKTITETTCCTRDNCNFYTISSSIVAPFLESCNIFWLLSPT